MAVTEQIRVRRRAKVRRRRRDPRRLLRRAGYVVGTLALLGILGALSLIPALRAKHELEQGRVALVAAQRSLVAGDAPVASETFRQAEAAFIRASGQADNMLLRLQGSIPFVGRTADALDGLAETGQLIAQGGYGVASAIAGLPHGMGSLALRDGRIPVDALSRVSPAVDEARTDLAAALEKARSLSASFVLPQVASARDLVLDELDGAVKGMTAADELLRVLPQIAGVHSLKHYFVAVQNPAELRGTGGFIGVYGILTLEDGRIDLSPFRGIETLPDVPAADAPAPSEGFREVYDRWGGAGSWRDLNMTPDAPTAGSIIEHLYEQVRGLPLDGTLFVDPEAFAAMLRATGPVETPALSRTLTADDVVPFLTNELYFEPGTDAGRKRALGLAAGTVLERFLSGVSPSAGIHALAGAAGGGHIVFHAADPQVEASVVEAGIGGVLGAPRGDFLGFFVSNIAANKVDFYVSRHLRYDVVLGAAGSAAGQLTVDFTNDAPQDAQPNEALGPYYTEHLGVGDDLSLVSVYCTADCLAARAAVDDHAFTPSSNIEKGNSLYSTYLRLNAGSSRQMRWELRTRGAWEGDSTGGVYHLTLQAQPGIRPMPATVVIRVPDGMQVTSTNVPMRVSGAEVSWTGTLGTGRSFEIGFQKPLLPRLWSELTDFLSKAVIHL